MPRKPVDTTKGLVAVVRNPETGRYVRVNSKIGRGLLHKYEPKQEMSEEMPDVAEKKSKTIRSRAQKAHVQFKEQDQVSPAPPKHPVEIDEIARQLELLRQRLVPPTED